MMPVRTCRATCVMCVRKFSTAHHDPKGNIIFVTTRNAHPRYLSKYKVPNESV
eukprot:UN20580